MAAPTGVLNGTEIKIYVAGTLVAYATTGSININHSLREITSKDSGGWKEQMEGLRDWSIDLEGMYAWTDSAGASVNNADDLFASYIATRTSFTIVWGTTDVDAGDTKYSGTAYLGSISMSGATEDSATYSASFSGSGAITQTVS
jgi:TP901-1 family phage major tail protein